MFTRDPSARRASTMGLDSSTCLPTAAATRMLRRAEIPGLRQQWPDSQQRWDAVREQFPEEPRAWIEAAIAREQSWRGEEAVALLEAGIARLPEIFDVMFYWALFHARNRSHQDALTGWARLRAAFPHRPTAYVFSARSMQDFGLAADAEALVIEAPGLFQGDPEILRVPASCLPGYPIPAQLRSSQSLPSHTVSSASIRALC